MKDWTKIRQRYLRDELPTRRGGIAANLARIKSFSGHEGNYKVVEHLLDESKLFIEWTAADTEVNIAAELVELQVQLALWHRKLAHLWTNPKHRLDFAEQSDVWSKRVLEVSGLLEIH